MDDHDPTPETGTDFTPVPRKTKRHDGWTATRQRAFIAALCETGSVGAAARRVGKSAESAYHLRRQSGAESFVAAWDAAIEHRIGILRDSLIDRAIYGVEVPVMSGGKQIGTRQVYNDRIATFILRSYDGLMSGGASGPPLAQRRAIAEAVAAARLEWDAEQERKFEEGAARTRIHMDQVRANFEAALARGKNVLEWADEFKLGD
jgi:hypothetical protein